MVAVLLPPIFMEKMYIAKLMYHKWEEGMISGIELGYKGTFAIFFYGCNLKCVYCQNSKISKISVDEIYKYNGDIKIDYTSEELSEKILEAEKNGAYTISFITGTFYRKNIIETIKLAKKKGLKIPIVYNSSGYELAEHIREYDGLVDIYLPDFKYYNDDIGKRYSHVSNYFEIASDCIKEMYRQVGNKMIVRHLVLPSYTEDSKKIIEYLYKNYGDDIKISIMSQYTPIKENLVKYPEICRKLTKREYDKVVDYAIGIGVNNAYIQDLNVASESFIPDFVDILGNS